MSENVPQKYKEKFFSKFINKLKMFFSRTKEEIVVSNDKNNKKDMINNLKVDIDVNINTEYEKKTFMKNLTDNPELLENFSNDKLEKILQYYLDENEKKREILKKIRA